MKKSLKFGGIIALGLALLIVLMVALGCGPPEEAVPRSYSCAVYTEQGCAKFVVASGGEIEIQSGGTFDLQSGATVDFSGGVDLDSSTLTWDADGDTTSVAGVDDTISTTLGAVTGTHNILTGCLKVGNGSPSLTLSQEDAYVEGTFEADGAVRFDGAIDANSTADIAGDISSSVGAITITDDVYITGTFDVDGNISSGTGAITITDDINITGTLTLPENSIEPDDVAVMHDLVIFCGQADENGTIYYGPVTAVFGGDGSASYAISSAGCDALDNATEGTADAPIMTDVAFKITGLFCAQSGTLGSGEAVTFTMRSAEADTTPVISCVISEGETDCRSLTASTTDIAAGATVAVKAVQASDNSDDDHWCKVGIAYK